MTGERSTSDDDLIAALGEAEEANVHGRPCQVCQAMESMSPSARAAVERALAGTIGERRISEILTQSGYRVGRRAVARHRQEGHSAS